MGGGVCKLPRPGYLHPWGASCPEELHPWGQAAQGGGKIPQGIFTPGGKLPRVQDKLVHRVQKD